MTTARANRRQHFVPAAYLQQFASPREREGWLHVFDGGASRRAHPSGICHERDFYTETHNADEAALWSPSESGWPPLVAHYLGGGAVRERDLLVIAGFVTELHYRNRGYENDSSGERIEQVMGLITAGRLYDFAGVRVVERELPPDELRLMVAALYARWRFALLPTPSGQVLTTDNPAIRFAVVENEPPIMYALPFDPQHWLFLYDETRSVLVGNAPTVEDMMLLRFASGVLAGREFYGVLEVDEGEAEHARAALEEGRERRGRIEDGSAVTYAITPPALSFWRARQ